jgi:hypothetical protein
VLPEEGLHLVRLLGGQEPLRHGFGQLSQQKARLVPGRIEMLDARANQWLFMVLTVSKQIFLKAFSIVPFVNE